MIFLFLLVFAEAQTPIQSLWALRAGCETENAPSSMIASLYFRAVMTSENEFCCDDYFSRIQGGDISAIVPLAALLVSEGRIDMAEVYWDMEGRDLPATRENLLDALAWFGRYELYPVMALNPAVPPDMEGAMHSVQCGAVCALGWMAPREDGLFHGEEILSPADIKILSGFFPRLNPDMRYISVGSLNRMFQASTGLQR